MKREKLATMCLMLGMFFNPFGYDALFKVCMDLLGGYWNAVGLFYCLALALFLAYLAKRRNFFLMAALFFNPFGYDVAFKTVMDLTGSYWITTSFFYLAAGSLFGLYFYFSRTNPVEASISYIKTKWQKQS